MKLAAALTALATLGAAAAVPAVVVSRVAEKDCVWRTYTSTALGLEVPVQRCDYGFRVIDFTEVAGKPTLYQSMKEQGKDKTSVDAAVTVFEKKADERPDEAIRRVAFKKLDRYQRKHCVVVAKHVAYLKDGKAAFTIVPDEKYQAEVERAAGADIPPPPCGELGDYADGRVYWEFHPVENPRRFVFVNIGQDTPLFDETALRFLP